MRLGQEVLSKIENLLIRCDNKEQPQPKRKPRAAQQNQDSHNTFIKLYHDSKIQQKRQQQRQQEKQQNDLKKISPFKITNKHTIFLNAQKQHRPIHERLKEIQAQKMAEMMRLRQKYPKKQQQYQNEEEEETEEEFYQRKKREKKFTEKEAIQKVEQLQEKERMRIQRLNMLKIKVIQDYSKDFKRKPYVGKGTDQMWNRYKLKKQLSNSVFERFQQYEMERKYHLQTTEKRVRQEVTPFVPKISQNSRLLASRSSSKTNLQQSLSRSCSCKCFQRTRYVLNNSTVAHSSRKV